MSARNQPPDRGQQGRHTDRHGEALQKSTPSKQLAGLQRFRGFDRHRAKAVVEPAEGEAPYQKRDDDPRRADQRPIRDPPEAVLDDKPRRSEHAAENRAGEQGGLVGQTEHHEENGCRRNTGAHRQHNGQRLLCRLRRRASCGHVQRTAEAHAGIDCEGHDRAGQHARDPVEQIERHEREAGKLPTAVPHDRQGRRDQPTHDPAVARRSITHHFKDADRLRFWQAVLRGTAPMSGPAFVPRDRPVHWRWSLSAVAIDRRRSRAYTSGR